MHSILTYHSRYVNSASRAVSLNAPISNSACVLFVTRVMMLQSDPLLDDAEAEVTQE